MDTNNWVPTETEWGEAAYQEIMEAFPGKLKSRSVALCVWCYAQDPDVTENQIERIAQCDPVIIAERQKKKIGAPGQRRAKALLGLDKPADDEPDPNLSPQELELLRALRDGGKLVEDYRKAENRLRRAEAALEKAHAAVTGITPLNARRLAQADEKARPVLQSLGLLDARPTTAAPTTAPTESTLETPPPMAEPAFQPLTPKVEPRQEPEPEATLEAPTPAAEPERAFEPPTFEPEPEPAFEAPVFEPEPESTFQPPTFEAPTFSAETHFPTPEPAPETPFAAPTYGVEPEPPPEAEPSDPVIVDPDEEIAAADIAVDILNKRVTTAPNSSICSVDDVPAPFASDDSVVEDEFASNMDACTEDYTVYWPTDEEPLSED